MDSAAMQVLVAAAAGGSAGMVVPRSSSAVCRCGDWSANDRHCDQRGFHGGSLVLTALLGHPARTVPQFTAQLPRS